MRRTAISQTPLDEMVAAQPTRAIASTNWMKRRESLLAHMPFGEMKGGGGLTACVMLPDGRC